MSVWDYLLVHALAMLTMAGAIDSTSIGAPPSDPTDIIVYEHAPDALAPWPGGCEQFSGED